MVRRVFFSFHYERDIFRVSQVRNSGLTKGTYEQAGFIDHADWESLQRQGDSAIRRWIDGQLDGASVTVVLIGAETASRNWVTYEIQKSHSEGKGLLGVYINRLKDPRTLQTDARGPNPLDFQYDTSSGWRRPLSALYRSYDWVDDNGFASFSTWVEEAARAAGR